MQSTRKNEEKGRWGIILRDDNYAQWSAVMKRVLLHKGLWYCINPLVKPQEDCETKEEKDSQGKLNLNFKKVSLQKAFKKIQIQRMLEDKKEPEGDAVKSLTEWKYDKDQKETIAIIITACDEVNVARIKDIEEPSFVWNALADHHCNRTNENISNLMAEIRERHQDGGMEQYIIAQKATYVAYQLAGGTMNEHSFCLMVVRNLSQDFDVQAGLLSASTKLRISSVEVALKTAYATFIHRKAHRKPKVQHKQVQDDMNATIQLAVAKALHERKSNSKKNKQLPKGICYHFANHGTCRWGEKCKWKHVAGNAGERKAKTSKKKSKTTKGGDSSSTESDSE
jgi:hypothetical protein